QRRRHRLDRFRGRGRQAAERQGDHGARRTARPAFGIVAGRADLAPGADRAGERGGCGGGHSAVLRSGGRRCTRPPALMASFNSGIALKRTIVRAAMTAASSGRLGLRPTRAFFARGEKVAKREILTRLPAARASAISAKTSSTSARASARVIAAAARYAASTRSARLTVFTIPLLRRIPCRLGLRPARRHPGEDRFEHLGRGLGFGGGDGAGRLSLKIDPKGACGHRPQIGRPPGVVLEGAADLALFEVGAERDEVVPDADLERLFGFSLGAKRRREPVTKDRADDQRCAVAHDFPFPPIPDQKTLSTPYPRRAANPRSASASPAGRRGRRRRRPRSRWSGPAAFHTAPPAPRRRSFAGPGPEDDMDMPGADRARDPAATAERPFAGALDPPPAGAWVLLLGKADDRLFGPVVGHADLHVDAPIAGDLGRHLDFSRLEPLRQRLSHKSKRSQQISRPGYRRAARPGTRPPNPVCRPRTGRPRNRCASARPR